MATFRHGPVKKEKALPLFQPEGCFDGNFFAIEKTPVYLDRIRKERVQCVVYFHLQPGLTQEFFYSFLFLSHPALPFVFILVGPLRDREQG